MCVVFIVVTVGFCLLAVQAWADSPKVDIDIPYARMSEKLIIHLLMMLFPIC
jgi:hypothetical protein